MLGADVVTTLAGRTMKLKRYSARTPVVVTCITDTAVLMSMFNSIAFLLFVFCDFIAAPIT